MKGIKIRITNPLRQAIFKAFGALPAPLSIKEVYGALRQGVFEAQENPVSTIWGHKFYEVQKYVNLTGHVWSYWVISANKKFMDSLSSGHRKIFTDTLNDAVAWLNKTVPGETNTLLKKMEKKGVTVIKPDIAAFQKIAAPIVRKFASEKCRPGLLDDIAKYK
jgi:TRAP-type C4-dicarboxylate transport system substrate-binding protein